MNGFGFLRIWAFQSSGSTILNELVFGVLGTGLSLLGVSVRDCMLSQKPWAVAQLFRIDSTGRKTSKSSFWFIFLKRDLQYCLNCYSC